MKIIVCLIMFAQLLKNRSDSDTCICYVYRVVHLFQITQLFVISLIRLKIRHIACRTVYDKPFQPAVVILVTDCVYKHYRFSG